MVIETIIDRVQRQLERIYEVESGHPVSEFLVSDPQLVEKIDPTGRDVQEKLLVRERGSELDLALYVDRAVLDRLVDADPTRRLDESNLGDYCVLLEGVSHFVYLTWNARRERPVTLLELELQAEVDKFVSSIFWMGSQRGVPRRLGSVLFDDPSFDEQLEGDDLARYETANRAAAKYCLSLEERFLRAAKVRDLVEDVRRFYRLPQEEKLRAAHLD